MGSALKITSLALRRTPGFAQGLPFVFSPGTGLTIIQGPNGSGKTSSALAAQSLLWPEDPEFAAFSVSGELEYEGDIWSLDLVPGARTVQRAGKEHPHPVGLAPTARGRYSLGLHELIQADNHAFAQALKKESSGGFDLQAAMEKLGFELKNPRKGGTAYHNLQNALNRLNKANAAQADLKNQERELGLLHKTLERVRADQAELERLQSTRNFLLAQADLKKAELGLSGFDQGMSRITGQETGHLDRIKDGIRAESREKEKSAAELARARTELQGLDLPSGGVDPVFLETLQGKVEKLRTLDGRASELERELAQAQAEIAKERRRLGIAEDDGRLDDIDLSGINDIADLARRAEQVRASRKARETLEAWLGQDREEPDLDQLKKGLGLLLEWLLDVEEEPSSRAALRKLLVFVGGGLVGAGIVLAWWQHWGWAGAALAGAAMLFWGLRPQAPANHRIYCQDNFQKLGLTPPNSWTLPEVKQAAKHLWEKVGQGELAREKRMKWEGLDRELEELGRQEARLTQRRREVASLMGIKPNLDEAVLFNLVERLNRFQDSLNKQATAQAALSQTQNTSRELAKELSGALAPFDYQDLTGVSHYQAAINNLAQKAQQHFQLKSDIQHWQQRIDQAQIRIAALEKELNQLFADLGLEPDQEHILHQRVESLSAYREARERLASARRDFELAQENIDPQSDLATKSMPELEELIREKKVSVDRLDQLNQQIGSLGQKLESAKQGHDLEEALAQVENRKEDLRRERDKFCCAGAGYLLGRYLEKRNKAESMPRVFGRAKEYFRLFTKGAFALDFEAKGPEFRAFDTALNLGRSLDELSSGTRVQLLMAVRIAFVEDQEKGPMLPLFLDEALANSDPERTGAIMDSVCRILKTGRQIFYFTARPAEILHWQSLLRENGLEPPTVLDLEDLKAKGRTRRMPLKEIPVDSSPKPPLPQGMSRQEYGELLRVPEFDPSQKDMGQTHIWHLLEDQNLVHQALCAGYKDWGPFKSMLLAGALPFLEPGRAEAGQALASARVLEEAAGCWRIGRGRRVTRQDLSNGGVSDTFLAKVAELNQEGEGRAEPLLQGLKDKKVPRFQTSAITRLEEYLEEAGCLDPRPRLTKDQALEKVLLALAPELKKSLLTPVKVEALVSRLDFNAD